MAEEFGVTIPEEGVLINVDLSTLVIDFCSVTCGESAPTLISELLGIILIYLTFRKYSILPLFDEISTLRIPSQQYISGKDLM